MWPDTFYGRGGSRFEESIKQMLRDKDNSIDRLESIIAAERLDRQQEVSSLRRHISGLEEQIRVALNQPKKDTGSIISYFYSRTRN